MDFRQLEAFVAVVEKNNFSEAAKSLFLTQPTISAHIRALEEELNTSLIVRTTKSVTITKEGYKLYEYAVNMLRLKRKAKDEFSSCSDTMIYVGASTIPSAYLLPEIMKQYRKVDGKAIFSVYSGDSSTIINKLIDGSIDIGIVGMATGAPQIEFKAFAQDKMVLCTPATEYYQKMKQENRPLNRLLEEPVIMRQQGSGIKKEVNYLLEKLGIPEANLNIIAYMNDLEAIRHCISKGMGISLMSYMSVRDAATRGEVLTFDSDELTGGRTFYLATRKDRQLKKQEADFIEFIGSKMAGKLIL